MAEGAAGVKKWRRRRDSKVTSGSSGALGARPTGKAVRVLADTGRTAPNTQALLICRIRVSPKPPKAGNGIKWGWRIVRFFYPTHTFFACSGLELPEIFSGRT